MYFFQMASHFKTGVYVYVYVFVYVYAYIYLYLSEFTKIDPKKQQNQSNCHRKKTFKIEHF